MWYRKVLASLPGIATNSAGEKQSNLDQEIQGLNVQAEQLYPELEKMLKELNFDPKEYESLPDHARKNIWDIIVHKYDTNLYNDFEDSDTPGFDATEARRHSPYHSNPAFTSMEEQLEATRHDTVDREPNNMLQAEKGNGGMAMFNGKGVPQYASGKGARMFYDNLPSNQTLV
jgi:hypothetical protein